MRDKNQDCYFISQLPGSKSDVKDAQWIAERLLKDLIRSSFVARDGLYKRLFKKIRKYFEIFKQSLSENCFFLLHF